MSQLALPLDWPDDARDTEFLVSESNAQAVQAIKRWGAWPVMTALLVGPRKSGRSLLSRIFAAESGGKVIDNAQSHAETAIFHAWNAAQETRRPLLVIADAAPPQWQVGLADLRSRLAATPVLTIDPPDEPLRLALLERHFLKRGLDARPDLLQWLLPRMERSHFALVQVVDLLEQAAFEQRRRLSISLARATLQAAGMIAELPQSSGTDRL